MENSLREEIQQLKKIVAEARKRLKTVPKGKLRINKKRGDAQEIITERGERVRSKSEKIIADKLHALGIPYRYEYPLVLEGNIKIYPDFAILKMPQREEVYLEHFGLMDNIEYMDSVIYKLNTYERNGIYLGVNLYITHETSKVPLNTRALDGMIKQLFCVEDNNFTDEIKIAKYAIKDSGLV